VEIKGDNVRNMISPCWGRKSLIWKVIFVTRLDRGHQPFMPLVFKRRYEILATAVRRLEVEEPYRCIPFLDPE
jgi:hypothetical protein